MFRCGDPIDSTCLRLASAQIKRNDMVNKTCVGVLGVF